MKEESYYTIPNDYTCYCYLFAMDNNNKIVFDKNESTCYRTNIYKYKKGHKWLKACNPYFEIMYDDRLLSYTNIISLMFIQFKYTLFL